LFISLIYFFTVESALEASKELNNELKSGLTARESIIHALLANKTCKKNYITKILQEKSNNRKYTLKATCPGIEQFNPQKAPQTS